MGALDWDKVEHKHQGWRLFTCIWLHAGVIHLVANMLSLVFIGIRIEQQFGFGMFLFLFLNDAGAQCITLTMNIFSCTFCVYNLILSIII